MKYFYVFVAGMAVATAGYYFLADKIYDFVESVLHKLGLKK